MYLPLEMCKNLDVRLIPDENSWKTTLLRASNEAGEVLSFLWAKDTQVLSPDYTGKFKYLNDMLLSKRKSLYNVMGINDYERLIKDKEQDRASAQESLSMFLMLDRWSKHKEVYRFDAELELALTDTEDVRLPIKVLDKLPFSTFYIEFAKNGIYSSNFHGAFVTIVKNGSGYTLVTQRVKANAQCMFGACQMIPESGSEDAVFVFDKKTTETIEIDRNKDWKEFSFFLLNALLYLCAENGEVRESTETKYTYHPSSTVKNKYAEVRKWECGLRYGENIRLSKKATVQEKDKSDTQNILTAEKQRHLPCVHTRRAHWHHYWVGKGRSELVLRWIAPTIVGGDKVETAVIHNVAV